MSDLQQAIEKSRKELEDLDELIAKRRKIQQDLDVLLQAQKILGNGSGIEANINVKISSLGSLSQTTSISSDVITILEKTNKTLSPTQIMYELKNRERPISQNALASVISRLKRMGKIQKTGRGAYRAKK